MMFTRVNRNRFFLVCVAALCLAAAFLALGGGRASLYDRGVVLFTRAGFINWVVVAATMFLAFSVGALAFALSNERRRKGRRELRYLLARKSTPNSFLSVARCGNAIMLAMSSGNFDELNRVPLATFVIDHYVDYSFNVKLYSYIRDRLDLAKAQIELEQVERLAQALNAWDVQCTAVAEELDAQVRGYEGVETDRRFRRALAFLQRRERYFVGVFDNFLVEIKDAALSALQPHMKV